MKNNSRMMISLIKRSFLPANLINSSKLLSLSTKVGFILLSSLLSYQFAFAADDALAQSLQNGKKLYEQKCQGCHDNKIHTRPNRIIHTYGDLVARVKFCDGAAKSNFTEKELVDVIDYLNDTFYKFLKEP